MNYSKILWNNVKYYEIVSNSVNIHFEIHLESKILSFLFFLLTHIRPGVPCEMLPEKRQHVKV